MHPALENLCGPGKSLKAEPPDDNEIETDLISATEAVFKAIQR